MTDHPHPSLARLDSVAAGLSRRPDVVAVLGLGSAGVATERFDDHSDLDVFVVVEEGAVEHYVGDVSWLEPAGAVVFSFQHEEDGQKVLLEDGLFVEYAVFTLAQLRGIAFSGARVVWARDDAPPDLATSAVPLPRRRDDTIGFHVQEASTNLLVGLHRELRGEHLTAARFVQQHALDRLVDLLALTVPATAQRDPFEVSRRVERAWGPDVLPLAELAPGYGRTASAARAALDWLQARFTLDPAIVTAIEALLAEALPLEAARHGSARAPGGAAR